MKQIMENEAPVEFFVPVAAVLDGAAEEDLYSVAVVGVTRDGRIFAASSISTAKTRILLRAGLDVVENGAGVRELKKVPVALRPEPSV